MEKMKDKVLAKNFFKPLAPVPKVGTDMIFKAYNKLFIS
jgi:hypothetical protein